jgi:hypothetical protein
VYFVQVLWLHRLPWQEVVGVFLRFSYYSIHQRILNSPFGLKASANLLNINFDKLNQYDPNDYSFENNIDNKFSPNIGVGLYWYSDNTYIGLSVPNLLETKHFDKYAGRSFQYCKRGELLFNSRSRVWFRL